MTPDPQVWPIAIHVHLDPKRALDVLEHVGRILEIGARLSRKPTR